MNIVLSKRDDFRPQIFKVVRVRRETKDIVTVAISPAQTEQPSESFAFLPGQFVMLYIFGLGEVPISIAGSSKKGELELTVKAVGTVTKAIVGLKRGQSIGVRGAFGSFWPLELVKGRDLLLIGGGVGLPPLRSVVQNVLRSRNEYSQVTLIYGARKPEEMIYREEIENWKKIITVRQAVEMATPAWTEEVGVVTNLIGRSGIEFKNGLAFICGPEVMIRYCVRELLNRGMSKENIFVSMERNMKCALGLCGRCQFGAEFVCKDGPVFAFARIERIFSVREV